MKRNSVFIIPLINMLLLSVLFFLPGCGGGEGGGGTPSRPGAFDLISPSNGDTASPNPTFSWSAASDAASYTIEIASDGTFSAIVRSVSVASPLTSYTVSASLTDGPYAWRVSAVNSGGTTSPTSLYYTFTVAAGGGLQWMKNSNPVPGQDAQAFALAIDSSSMYVVGYDFGAAGPDDRWRIEKRSLSSGELDSSFGLSQGHAGFVTSHSSPSSFEDVFSIATDTTRGYMYLVGYESDDAENEKWRIEKRSLATGETGTVISENTGTGGLNEAQAVALDSTSLYVGGFDAKGLNGDEQWRIEKRDLVTGNTDTNFDSDGIISDASVTAPSAVNAIAVDAAYIYAVGYYAALAGEGWYIEKRDKTTGAIVSSITSSLGSAKALAIDDTYMYIAGYDPSSASANTSWRIEKRLLVDLSLVTLITSEPSTGSDVPNAIAIDETYIYVAGYDSNTSDANKEQWRIEKYEKNTGAPASSFGAGNYVSNNPSDYNDEIWSIAVDATAIYLVGYDSNTPLNNTEWRIEKRTK